MVADKITSELLGISRKLPVLGLATGSTGNVSARDPETGFIVIKCSGVSYDKMTKDDFAVLSPDGDVKKIKDGLKPSLETPTHLEVYKRYPDIHCVIHTHTKFAIILSAGESEIPCATTPTGRRLLKKPVPVIDFVENGTNEMANKVAPYFNDNVAVMIKNHGSFIVGDCTKTAFDRVVGFNDATEVYYYMKLAGKTSLIS